MNKKNNYEAIYFKNEETGRIIIDVALNDYLEFFHEWDNAAFKKRDMHPELVDFLNLCSEEIPMSKGLEIKFYIESETMNKEKEELIRTGYHNHFNSLICSERKKEKRIVTSSGILLLTSLVLLFFYTAQSGKVSGNIFSTVLLESLLIGGWVLTWEAFHGITIDIIEPRNRRKELERFLSADISFKCLIE